MDRNCVAVNLYGEIFYLIKGMGFFKLHVQVLKLSVLSIVKQSITATYEPVGLM